VVANLSISEIVLRKPEDADASDALAMLMDPEVVRWNPAPEVRDLASAVAWCRRGADWTDGTHATFHAIHVPSSRLLANVSVHAIETSSRTARIGYRVAPWARRQGVGSSSVETVSKWSFLSLKIDQIDLQHDFHNEASCRLATTSGYQDTRLACSLETDAQGKKPHELVHVHTLLSTDCLASTSSNAEVLIQLT
jgi:RimJ/RimL family protein N-acetyltransferase